MSEVAEAPAPVGHNNPPAASPYEAIRIHIEDLWTEACNWADGAKIENQDQADAVAKLIDDFRAAHTAADDARKAENKPFDDGKAEVQERYAPLIADTKAMTGKTVKALAALKAVLTPWLLKLDAEKREQERLAREAADRAAAEAAAAVRAANPDNLAELDAAEIKVAEANIAQSEAKAAANDRAHARGDGRAIGLRTSYRPVMTDRREALKHYLATQPDAIVAFVQQLAEADVRRAIRTIPGFMIEEVRAA